MQRDALSWAGLSIQLRALILFSWNYIPTHGLYLTQELSTASCRTSRTVRNANLTAVGEGGTEQTDLRTSAQRVERSRSQIKKVKPLLLGWIPSVSQKFKPFHLGIMPDIHRDGGENWPPPIGQSHIIIWTANNVKRTWFKKTVRFHPHFCLIYCLVSGWRAPIKFAKLRGAKVGSVSDHPHFGCRQHQLLASIPSTETVDHLQLDQYPVKTASHLSMQVI